MQIHISTPCVYAQFKASGCNFLVISTFKPVLLLSSHLPVFLSLNMLNVTASLSQHFCK